VPTLAEGQGPLKKIHDETFVTISQRARRGPSGVEMQTV